MEVNESNKMIALFMGFKTWRTDSGGIIAEDELAFAGNIQFMKCFQYQSDWNLLLRVVHKIAELEKQHMDCSYHFGKVLLLPITTPIEVAYAAIAEFINWYNTKKTDNGNDKTGK